MDLAALFLGLALLGTVAGHVTLMWRIFHVREAGGLQPYRALMKREQDNALKAQAFDALKREHEARQRAAESNGGRSTIGPNA